MMTDTTFTMFVPGRPVPQGSKTAFVNKKTGRPIVVDKDMRLPEWRMKITAHARDAIAHHSLALMFPMTGPVGIRVDFILDRHKSHYGTGKNAGVVKESAPRYPATMPDIDKLLRAILDGLTDARVWDDDGQVVWVQAGKYWAGPSWPQGQGARITLGRMK
jgi:Holliday junction resolvase RusA-like endonuclease